MKIRKLVLEGVRNFKARREISFENESTGLVRPLTVLVGANGSGKTTVFEAMFAILGRGLRKVRGSDFARDLLTHGFAGVQLAFSDPAPMGTQDISIVLAGPEWARDELIEWPNVIALFGRSGGSTKARVVQHDLRDELRDWINLMTHGDALLRDGVIYFPHHRWLENRQSGPIEPPPTGKPWIYRFSPSEQWQGSLSQLWVWQNYLDLEEAREGRPRLTPFIEVVEEILGDDQRVVIRQGQVHVHRPKLGDEVSLQQLPAGLQQVLTLFGELVRRMRPGAVVLIDEMELSLHPALQRKVLFHLRQLTAKYDLQVIVATHSMEVVAAVGPHEVVNLDNMVLEERRRAEGGSASAP